MKTYQHRKECCAGADLIRIGLALAVVGAVVAGGIGIAIIRGGCQQGGKVYRWAARWIKEFKPGERTYP